jgi:hypothetical protein
MQRDSSLNQYTFATLTLTFKGLGLPFLSDKTKALIAAMPLDEAKAVNRVAWKASKESAHIMNRYCNFSIAGNASIYDHASQRYHAAEHVKRATWKRIKELQGS